MKLKSLILSYLAAGLLVCAPQAMAGDNDISLVIDVDSASGQVTVDADLCMAAVSELINEDGYELRSTDSLGVDAGPDLSTYLFSGMTHRYGPDVVTLYCIADLDIDGPDGPDGPDGMSMCGGAIMGC